MPESTESKPNEPRAAKNRLRAIFVPRTMGIFILLIIILSFAAGTLRQELALILAGAVFLTIWVYCLIMTLLLALIHSRRARRAGIRVSPREVSAGETAEAVYSEGEASVFKGAVFQLPGIVVRCRLLLVTKDGRRIQYDFSAANSAPHFFMAEKRGAYFSAYDELGVFDILGLFRFAYRLPADPSTSSGTNARLLVSPRVADEPLLVNARAGESMLKPEFSFQRTDNLIDHRPYVPGDDPRRINWKLFGHGGGLFVREGEYEPPPQSNIIILIDTEYDPLLYSAEAAQQGIDLLCENALAAALACTESGMEVLTGYTGGVIRGGNTAEIASALAWPAAVMLSHSLLELPAAPSGCGILILSLPRSSAETSAIDRFLNNTANRYTEKNKARTIELLFLYDNTSVSQKCGAECLAAAEACAALYNQRFGVRAQHLNLRRRTDDKENAR